MYINNVGSISQALFARDNPDFDTVLSAQWQATQVSLVSIANCVGRIALGSAADFGKHHWGWHRSYWMSIISIIFILSQIFVFAVEGVTSLWQASVTLGFAYGGMYGLFPTIMIESFGLGESLNSSV
jgi:MFS family permease